MAFASASRTAVSISNSLPGAHFIARAISRTPSTTGFMALGSAAIVMFSLQAEQTGMSPLSRLTFSKDIRSSLSSCSRDTGLEYTEPGMNRDVITGRPIGEGQLPERFESPDYQVLLVANKYQTGFDQPLL